VKEEEIKIDQYDQMEILSEDSEELW